MRLIEFLISVPWVAKKRNERKKIFDDFITFNYVAAALKSGVWTNLQGVLPQVIPLAHKYQMPAVIQKCTEVIFSNISLYPVQQLELVLAYDLATYKQWKDFRTTNGGFQPTQFVRTAFEEELPRAMAALCTDTESSYTKQDCGNKLYNNWKTKPKFVLAVLKLSSPVDLVSDYGGFCHVIGETPTQEWFDYLLEKGCQLSANILQTVWNNGNQKLFKTLLKTVKVDFNTVSSILQSGFIPLFVELVKQNPEVVNQTSDGNYGLLYLAVSYQLPYVTKMLLDMHADPNLGFPTHIAASRGSYDIFMMLLSYGANPFLPNAAKKNAFQYSSSEKVLRWIEQYHFEVGFSDEVLATMLNK